MENIKELLGKPWIQGLLALLALLLGFITFIQPNLDRTNQNISIPTPRTPAVEAIRDLDIRTGPGTEFPSLNILQVGDKLTIIGITEDRTYYYVLMLDGQRGWTLASEVSARYIGDTSVLRVITVTPTLTNIPTNRATETQLPSETPIPTNTIVPIPTTTLSPTPTFTRIPQSTELNQYPYNAQIDPNNMAETLRIVRQSPNNPVIVGSVTRGQCVTVIDGSSGNEIYYRIQVEGRTIGWVNEDYITLSTNCP